MILAYPFHGILEGQAEHELCFYLYEIEGICSGLVCSIPLSGVAEESILCHEEIYLQRSHLLLEEFSRSQLQHNPVLLITESPTIKQTISSLQERATLISKKRSSDGFSHNLWKVVFDQPIDLKTPLCVADGHHRFAALLQYYQGKINLSKPPHILAAVFNADQVVTRTKCVVVEDVEENTSTWMTKLQNFFNMDAVDAPSTPANMHEFSMLYEENWYHLSLKEEFIENREAYLGIEVLKKYVLQQTLNVEGYANCANVKVHFEKCNIAALLQKKMREKTIGFIAAADPSKKVIDIAREGRLLEANSTYFEPKLIDKMIGLQL